MSGGFHQRKSEPKIKTNTALCTAFVLTCLLYGGVFFVLADEQAPESAASEESEAVLEEESQNEPEKEIKEEQSKEGSGEIEAVMDEAGSEPEEIEVANPEETLGNESGPAEVDQPGKGDDGASGLGPVEQTDVLQVPVTGQQDVGPAETALRQDAAQDQKAAGEKSDSEDPKITISEVAWMGTEISYSDEWIELYNDGDEADLDGWKLVIESKKEIELDGKIKAKGYYLIERTDDNAVMEIKADLVASFGTGLNNSGEILTLLDGNGEEVDKVDASAGWQAGDNDTKLTMERDDSGNWQDSKCPGGTPRSQNGSADGCTQPEVCGNQLLEEGEECDDGNTIDGDGCSAECLIEPSGGNDELPSGVVINELLPDPEGSDTDGEWIELFNGSEKDVQLENCYLIDQNLKEKNDPAKYFHFTNEEIPARGFLVLGYRETKISLNNTGDILELYDPAGVLLSGVSYEKPPLSGYSWARRESGDYGWTPVPTPGDDNHFPPREVYSKKIKFNEILANPAGTDKGKEWIEFYSQDQGEVLLENWIIENGAGKSYAVKGQPIRSGSFAVVHIESGAMSVRNSSELLRLYDPNGDLVDEIGIVGYAKSGISYNKGPDGKWSWSKHLTPGGANKLNGKPVIKIKKERKIYRNVHAEFDGSKSFDPDGEQLKFKWEFGDGKKSYLEETRHSYEKKGKYRASLTISDGIEEVTKEFKVEVRSFPRYDIEIVGLMPNPAGNDKGNEVIILRNNESKRINLKGYYIHTGSSESQSVRHIIRKDFFLGPGQLQEMANGKICKYSLYNKQGAVVLTTPGGKRLDWVDYFREKIGDDDLYYLNEGKQWEWIDGAAEEQQMAAVVLGAGIEPDQEEIFDWTRVTMNRKLLCCETTKRQQIANWLHSNKQWLEQLFQFLNIRNFPFDALS